MRHTAQAALILTLAVTVTGWKNDSCDSSKDVTNPLNGGTRTRIYVTLQPPELRPYVSRLVVEASTSADNTAWQSGLSVPVTAVDPTVVDIDPAGGQFYRLTVRDACNNVVAQTILPTGAVKESGGDTTGPDQLNASLTLPASLSQPCQPSPSPSLSPSPSAPQSPAPSAPPSSPGSSAAPSAPPYFGGGGGGGGGGTPAGANVDVQNQVQRGTHAGADGNISAPSASPDPWVSDGPDPTPSPSPTPSFWP
jgi:hypothetical protein